MVQGVVVVVLVDSIRNVLFVGFLNVELDFGTDLLLLLLLQNSSDLVGLIQMMIMAFNEVPPVYSKPKTAQPPPSAYPTPYPTNPPGERD